MKKHTKIKYKIIIIIYYYSFILSNYIILVRWLDPGNTGCEVGINPGWETTLSLSNMHTVF